jgi:hypothetical protein
MIPPTIVVHHIPPPNKKEIVSFEFGYSKQRGETDDIDKEVFSCENMNQKRMTNSRWAGGCLVV